MARKVSWPEPRPREHGLHRDGAGDDETEVQRGERHDRQQGVRDYMLAQDQRFAHSFGPGGGDVVFVHRLDDAGAHDQGVLPEQRQAPA